MSYTKLFQILDQLGLPQYKASFKAKQVVAALFLLLYILRVKCRRNTQLGAVKSFIKAFSVMAILLFSCFVHVYLNYPESLHSMTEERPERQEDLIKFLTWGPKKQALMLSIPFIGSFVNGFKGALLLIGSIKRHLKLIKAWLVLTIVFMVSSMLCFIIEVIFTQDKALIVFLFLVDCIYEVYSIWVVKCLFHELRLETQSQYTHSTNITPGSYKSEQDLDIDTELTSSIDKF